MNYLDESVVLSPEQVTSVMLTYLKGVAQNALEKPVSDCVISVRFIFSCHFVSLPDLLCPQVPSYYTDAQRRAVLDASSISGLNCLRLLNETTSSMITFICMYCLML